MNVRFSCPQCEHAGRFEIPTKSDWQCPSCDFVLAGPIQAELTGLHRCAICANEEIYKKKDFPHWLGMTILTVACLGSVIPYWLYMQWLTWTILIGSAILDGVLYLSVGDVLVCYRCDAHYRGYASLDEHKPFELGIHERYRQERIRKEQLAAQARASGG